MRRLLVSLLSITVAAGLAFIVAIIGNVGRGVAVHEVAATVLLVLLLLALFVAWRLRATGRGPLLRIVIALGALVVAAGIGAGLAATALSREWSGLPLVPLAAMLVSLGDGIRLTIAAPTEPRVGGLPAGRSR